MSNDSAPQRRGTRPVKLSRNVQVVTRSQFSNTSVVILNVTENDAATVEEAVRAYGPVTNFEGSASRNGYKYEATFENADDAAKCVEGYNGTQVGENEARVALKRTGYAHIRLTRIPGDPADADPAAIYLNNTQGVSDEDLRGLFTGGIVEFNRPAERFALVTLESADEAQAAVAEGTKTVNGIEITVEAQKPPSGTEETPVTRVYVDNKLIVNRIRDVDDDTIMAALSDFGRVTSFRRSRNGSAAIVTFENRKAASSAAKNLRGKTLIEDGIPMRFQKFADYLTEEELSQQKQKQSAASNKREKKASNNKREKRKAAPAIEDPEELARTVYVAGTRDMTDEEMRGFFSGEVVNFKRIGRGRSAALITFASLESATAALDQNGTKLSEDKELLVSPARPRQPRNRAAAPAEPAADSNEAKPQRTPRAPRIPREDLEFVPSKDRVFFAGFDRKVTRDQFVEVFDCVRVSFRPRTRHALLDFDDEEKAQAAVNRNGEVIFNDKPARIEFARVAVRIDGANGGDDAEEAAE